MSVVCPTVTAKNAHAYREQIERVQGFVKRIHLDFADGELAPVKLVSLNDAWLPEKIKSDLHLMYKRPKECLEEVVKLKPNLVIVHAEAEGDFVEIADTLHSHGIKAGVALLPKTPVSKIEPSLDIIDHALIFSGNLGYFGGKAVLELLDKVKELKGLKPGIEIGWDGGINDENAKRLAEEGVDVLNAGSFIQQAESPQEAYATLESAVK